MILRRPTKFILTYFNSIKQNRVCNRLSLYAIISFGKGIVCSFGGRAKMYYASAGVLALILHITINGRILKKDRSGQFPAANVRYRQFLIGVTVYYVIDVLWGLLYEFRNVPGIYPFLYADGALYFLMMVATMLLWVRYVVSYLDQKGIPGKFLLSVGWAILTFEIIALAINVFKPVVFRFGPDLEYIPETGRHYTFLFQIVLYMLTSTYTLAVASRSFGRTKIHNRAVGSTCIVLELFLIFQILSSRFPFYAIGCLIGTSLIHVFIEEDERIDREKEKEIYDHIATGLAEDYEAIYYIDIETGRYREFSTSQEYAAMDVQAKGEDFYRETQENAAKYAHPADREFAQSLYDKETMLRNLEGKKSYSYKYRILLNGEARYFRFTVMRAYDGKHFVLYEKDINDEITAETARLESQKKHVTFGQIAESLAANYDVIYYVDTSDGSYISYATASDYGQLKPQREGADFFADMKNDAPGIVHEADLERIMSSMDRDHMLSVLEERKQYEIAHRIIMPDGHEQYVRMSARKTSDGTHFIVGIENIDDEVKKEKEHLRALNTEKELARRDELTGVKNKTAYTELERSIQADIDGGTDDLSFAIVVCDTNNLKSINDTEGHKAGDAYIKASAKLLCDIFDHSPVFRIGGDEFAVFLKGSDHDARAELMETLRGRVIDNLESGKGPVIAMGMAEYEPGTDSRVSDVFERADKEMYVEKQILKSGV